MYNINIDIKESNKEPWNILMESRIRKLIDKNNKNKNVVYIADVVNGTSFRYRVYNMCQALEYSNAWNATFFIESELKFLKKYLDKIDILIFSRTKWSLEYEIFLTYCKKYDIKLVFDVDDLVFDSRDIAILMNTLNIKLDENGYDWWFSYFSRINLMAKKCNFFIGTNNFLNKQIKRTFDKPTFSIDNFLNNEQLYLSQKLFNKKKEVKRKKPFKIGYFSGSPTHENDFKKVSSAISRLFDKYDDITLEVVGFMKFPDFMKKYEDSGRIKHIELMDFLTLQTRISQVDVNIIPLVDNIFTNCKSELKYFEASVVGTPSCATPTYVYENCIKDKKTGFLCKEYDWFNVIEDIYNNYPMSLFLDNANKYCIDRYSPKNQSKNIENVLNIIYESK